MAEQQKGLDTDTKPTATIQRVENAAVAGAVVAAMIATGQPWWLLPATFLVFDLSMAGYLRSARTGAALYNVVHNYTGSAIAIILYAVLSMALDANIGAGLLATFGVPIGALGLALIIADAIARAWRRAQQGVDHS